MDIISMLGYSNNSPFKGNPYLDIHTPNGLIDMSNTYMDLIGIDNKGNKKKMKAGRKNPYRFEGDIVREIPMAQRGLTFKPYWENEEDRNAYRNRLKDISTQALLPGEDSKFLRELPYAQNGPYCINGICGLNIEAGLKYNTPTDVDRYAGNTKFTDAVRDGKEDYYQVNGNFQIGDQLEYLDSKGKAGHAKIIYNISKNEEGNPVYHIIHNRGGKEFVEDIYTKQEMDDMVSGKSIPNTSHYKKVNVYRPGKALDINKLKTERTPPEALKALEDRKQNLAFQKFYDPDYTYSLKPSSEYNNDTPAGIEKYMEFANDKDKINDFLGKLDKVGLASKADKNTIHDSLLNVFGILGQENKFRKAPITGVSPRTAAENLFERVFKPKKMSIGPGQIKFSELDPEIKKEFGIRKPKDLYNWDKVIPLMTALDIKNKKWMESQGQDFTKRIVGEPGASSTELKWTEGRLSPYFWRGHGTADLRKFLEKEAEKKLSGYRVDDEYKKQYIEKYIAENIREHQKVLDEGSYADDVYDYINENLQRTAGNLMAEKPLQGITVTARKNKKLQGGGLHFLEPNDKKLPKGIGPYLSNSSELATSIGGENGEPAYLIPSMKYGRPLDNPYMEFLRTGDHLGGPFKTWQEADEWEKNVRHPYVEKGESIPTPIRRWSLKKGGNPYQEGGITPEQVFGFLFDGDDERKQQKEELRLLQERELAVEENEMRQAAQLREIGRQRKMMEEEAQYNLAMGLAMEDGNLDLNSPRFTNTTPIVQSSKPFVATNTDLYGTAKQYEGTPYKFAGTGNDGIDCSGYVCRVVGLPRTSSEEIVKNAPNFRQFTGNPYDFKEGTVIGFDTGIASFEKKEGNKRKYGMDHVGVIVRKPETGELLYTHSAGSTGVKTMTIPEMLRKYKNSRIFLGDYGQKTK